MLHALLPVHDDALGDHDVPEVLSIVVGDAEVLEGVATVAVRDLEREQSTVCSYGGVQSECGYHDAVLSTLLLLPSWSFSRHL